MSKGKKIVVVVTAYKVEDLLEPTINRIDSALWKKISTVLIINDCSPDETLQVAKRLRKKFPKITIINKSINEGYAQAQKTGYLKALKMGADIVVLLHGDGQYAPEELSKLLKPLERNVADIVQGSRILGGGALAGGMPLYKYVANRILSTLENLAFSMNLAEYHSGYMLYSRKALETIPFQRLSDTFHFDGEMLIMGKICGLKILQLPIPTTYAGETSSLKPIPYGVVVLKTILRYFQGHYHQLAKS
ncbi:MAG: glycosyltransferase family 2 protein [bacterium]|nr:glycosyltransferase family 2 protein [bacterium]